MSRLSSYPYKRCRGGIDGHQWERAYDDGSLLRRYPASRYVYRVAQTCDVCGGYKVRAYDRATMERLDSRSRYPKGYRLTKADTIQLIRLEQVKEERREERTAA